MAEEKVYKRKTSLPSRECGLKLEDLERDDLDFRSLPSRECGLKFKVYRSRQSTGSVTPFAGVWIEMD